MEGLREYPKEHFIKFRNMGQATLQELYQICEEQGIKLRSVEDLNDREHGVIFDDFLCLDAFGMGIKSNDCIAAEKKENKQLKRIMEFADNNNLIPMKVFRRGIFGRRLRDEVFYKAIRYMRAGKADALIVTNLDAISDGIADSYLKIGAVREAGYRLFSVDEKEPKVDLYIPPKRGDLQ